MQTPWGDLRVNDAHVHFFSHSFFSGLAQQKKLPNAEALATLLEWQIPPADPQFLAHTWMHEFDRAGVAKAALIASAPGDEAAVATACALFPDRFYGYFMLDPTQPDALGRVQSAATNPNLTCICLFPAIHHYSVTDPRLIPILELASNARMSVFVHCGAISVGFRKKLALPSQFDMRFSNPLDLHPVALHFPKIRFTVPHFGAGLFRETLMLADLCPNIYLDTSSSNRWTAYEALTLETVYERTLKVIGPKRLLFGTDSSYFPRGWHRQIFDDQTAALVNVGVGLDDAQAILADNFENFCSRT